MEVKLIKLSVGLFEDEKIAVIDSMPQCDTILTIWIKILCFAGRLNNGGVFKVGQTAYTAEMLAAYFRRPVCDIKFAVSVFEKLGMIELSDGVLIIKNWEKYQQSQRESKEEKRREYQRQYKAEQRKKESVNTNVSKMSTPMSTPMSTKCQHQCQHQCQQNVNKNELTSGENETPTLNIKEEKNQLQGANINVNKMLTTIENEVTKTKEEKRKEKEPKIKEEKNENKNSKHTHQNGACTRVSEGEPAKNPEESAAGRPSFEEVRAEFERRGAEDPNGEAEAFFDYNDTREKWTYWKKTVSLWMHRVKFKKAETPNISKSSFDATEFFDAAVNQTYRQEKGGG